MTNDEARMTKCRDNRLRFDIRASSFFKTFDIRHSSFSDGAVVQISGHTFLVTGAASGLGAACARLLVSLGGQVVVADLNAASGGQVAAELGSAAEFALTDVTEETQVEAAVAAAIRRFGRLDGVVNCVGILGAARIVGKQGPHDLRLFDRIMRINLLGTFNVLRLSAAAMTDNPPGPDGERGVIVNTSSVAAFEGQIGQAAYAASKGGVAALTLPAARELARFGIRVVAIAPGMFDTAMMSAANDDLRQSLIEQIPFPTRPGRPEEFARLVREIVENPFINGAVIRLDGGLRMGPR
jgi:NAD(P)-dependent dehydrogenase (short-subunit alcohol dehydrogenase family)